MWSMTNLPGKPLDGLLPLRQLAAVELDVGEPAERVHARHHLVHALEADRAPLQLEDALADDAGLGQALDLGLRRRRASPRATPFAPGPSALIAASVTRLSYW